MKHSALGVGQPPFIAIINQMKKSRKYLTSQVIWPPLVGFLAAALIILGIRFFAYKPEAVHYHANFAVYINGQRQEFKDPSFYESIGVSCDEHEEMTPPERTHMHDYVNDVVHVHDHAATWGQFFTNIGWIVDAKVIETGDQMLLADSNHKISFILNGETMDNVSNRVIGDQDKLLVDFGSGDQTIKIEYAAITNKAAKYDASKDPASCGSNAPVTTRERLKHLF